MGRGTKRRLREQEAAMEFEKARDQAVEAEVLGSKPDEELFTLDSEVKHSQRREARLEKRRKYFGTIRETTTPSQYYIKAVDKLVSKIAAGQEGEGDGSAKAKPKGKQIYDMWGGEETSTASRRQRTRAESAKAYKLPLIQTPLPGQSYNPASDDHDEAIKQAVEVELKREEAIAKLKAPLPGMSEETRALLLSSDDEDADESEDEGADGEGAAVATKRNKGKLTRAERNKIRRRKQAEHQAKQEKEKKQLAKQAGRVPELAKQLRREQEKKRQAASGEKPVVEDAAAASSRVLPQDKNPILARSVPVPLTDEVVGALRLVKAQGSLASESLEAYQRRGQYEVVPVQKKKQRRQSRRKLVERWKA